MRKGSAFHPSQKKRAEAKAELDRVRQLDRERKEAIEEMREEERQKRAEKKRRREINEKRAETTQALNPKKLRQKLSTMSKKQKRQIRKTSVSAFSEYA